jgi:hypothetical protein
MIETLFIESEKFVSVLLIGVITVRFAANLPYRIFLNGSGILLRKFNRTPVSSSGV